MQLDNLCIGFTSKREIKDDQDETKKFFDI